MTLRAAAPDDLDAIMALERSSFVSDAWSEAMMAAELASPHGCYLVDEQAGRLVGYGGVRAVARAADSDIQTIALAESVRGTGRGRALLRALLGAARERGARETFLEVRADNPIAQALYRSEGFVEIARRPRYYQPDDVDAIIMQLDLVAWAAARTDAPAAPASAPTLPASVPTTDAAAPDSDAGAGFGSSGPKPPNPASGSESDERRGGDHASTTAAKGWC